MIYISSQRERIESTVSEKIANNDFVVSYVNLNNGMRMIVDGHHSHQAAIDSDHVVDYVESEISSSYEQELNAMGLELFLEAHYIDSAWYDINTMQEVF